MKILYITSLSMEHKSGAQQHVAEIFNRLNQDGVETKLVSAQVFSAGIAGAITRKIKLARLTKKVVESFSPDIVYFRYEGADVLSIREIVKQKIPYILELNTKTIPELWATRRFLPWAVSLATEPWVFSNAEGIAAVSNEIYQYAVKKGNKTLPFLLAKNGVDVKSVNFCGYNPELRKKYDTPVEAPLLVMIGSLAPWHGLDLLFKALAMPDLNNYYLWLIGNVSIENLKKQTLNSNVLERLRLIRWQNAEKLSDILSAADVGIGALALFRKGIKEAQALKTRTCLASGLPVLLGHSDSTIQHNCQFISYGCYTSVINLASQIKEFCEVVKKDRIELGRQAREFAENYLSWDIAAKETLDFIKLVYANSKHKTKL